MNSVEWRSAQPVLVVITFLRSIAAERTPVLRELDEVAIGGERFSVLSEGEKQLTS
jgi:hypothetical protein